jgi:hypothetical protein
LESFFEKKYHRSAILNFLERLVTELVCTVLPHYRTLEATILDAIFTGKSFNFFISRALELALMLVELSFDMAECSEILGNLTFGMRSSSSSTVSILLLIVGNPKSFLLSLPANLFSKVTMTSLTS